MTELTAIETDQTAGGILPVLLTLLGAYVGQLMYEGMGGADGIEKGVTDVYDLFTGGFERKYCGKHPVYCD